MSICFSCYTSNQGLQRFSFTCSNVEIKPKSCLFPHFSVLPHVPIVDSKDICIITKDLQKGLKVDHEDTVNHFKDLLSSKGVEVSSVISLRELKVEYKQYEAKTALCHRHEAFLADEKIIRFLPKFLGKAFYKRRKFPIGINLESKNLSKEVEKALRTVNLPLSNMGTCSMIRIGHTNMKANHLTDNILQTTEILSKKYPGGWKNVRSIHLKTETSMSIPIHISDISANEIGFVDTSAAQKKKRENITDDLSTVLGGEVTITPNFDIRLKGAKMPKDEDDVIESEESDNENEENADKKKKAESKAEKKAEKKDKTVSKKRKHEDSDEDEDDKDMTKAEDEYLKRNAEQDEEEKDEEDEEGSGDEEEEIVDDDEESGDEEEDAEEGSEDDEQQSEEEEDESEEEEVAPPPKKAKKSKGIAPPPKKAGKSKGIAPPPKKARKSKK